MGKVCIVTGASRGLGRGIALVLAREVGCTVYATARNEEALKSLSEEAAAGAAGTRAAFLVAAVLSLPLLVGAFLIRKPADEIAEDAPVIGAH